MATPRFVALVVRPVEADGRGAWSNTTKSATSHVKGGFRRRSVLRWSVCATDCEDARRSPSRRSHETTTGSCAVFRASESKRCSAPRRTTIPTGLGGEPLSGRRFSTVFGCLRGTPDLSAGTVCHFATDSGVHTVAWNSSCIEPDVRTHAAIFASPLVRRRRDTRLSNNCSVCTHRRRISSYEVGCSGC